MNDKLINPLGKLYSFCGKKGCRLINNPLFYSSTNNKETHMHVIICSLIDDKLKVATLTLALMQGFDYRCISLVVGRLEKGGWDR